MNISPKLQVGLKDLDSITKSSLNYFFNSGLCPNAVLSEFNKDSDLLIIDHGPNATNSFLEGLKTHNQYAIILHAPTEEFVDGTSEKRLFGLAKPIQQNELREIIDKVFKLLRQAGEASAAKTILKTGQSTPSQNHELSPNIDNNEANGDGDIDSHQRFTLRKYIGSNNDIDLDDLSKLSQIYITPEKYLYHYLSEATKMAKLSKSDVIITTKHGRVLYENSSQKFYCFDWAKLKHVQPNPSFNDTKLALVGPNSDLTKTAALNATEVTWEAALLASKGRLPMGTNINNEIEIIYWPDLSKLITFEHVDQIIVVWALNPTSISATITQLKIPQRYVFTLYCAMQAINSVRVDSEENDVEESPKPSKKGLFSKLLGRVIKN